MPVLDMTIPVFNEERDLEECLPRLHGYLQESFVFPFRITVADSASSDETRKIAERVACELPEVAVVHLAEKGRGNALRKVRLASDAPVNNSGLNALLTSSGTKWSAIVSGATQAANLELATGTSVIALGGWNGSDPYPMLAQFQETVANGQIGHFIAGRGMGGGGGGMGVDAAGAGGDRGGNSEVPAWVAANFTAQTVGSSSVYKLSE
jgi:hypothetical protein